MDTPTTSADRAAAGGRGALGARDDLVLRVAALEDVGEPEGEAVDDRDVLGRERRHGRLERERLLDGRPAGGARAAVGLDPLGHLVVARLARRDVRHGRTGRGRELDREPGLAAPGASEERDEGHRAGLDGTIAIRPATSTTSIEAA